MDGNKCEVCGAEIPGGRLEALPGVTTCVEHSDAVPITDATYGVINISDDLDLLKSMQSEPVLERTFVCAE